MKNVLCSICMTAVMLLLPFCVSAQEVQTAVTLKKAGTLATFISDDEFLNLTSLKVSGPINGKDLMLIRHMAGATDLTNTTGKVGKLKNLDLSEANIVKDQKNFFCIRDVGNVVLNVYPRTNEEFKKQCVLLKRVNDRTLMQAYTEKNVLGSCSFYECPNIETVLLPLSLERCCASAFVRCNRLKSVMLPVSQLRGPVIPKNIFLDCGDKIRFIEEAQTYTFRQSVKDIVVNTREGGIFGREVATYYNPDFAQNIKVVGSINDKDIQDIRIVGGARLGTNISNKATEVYCDSYLKRGGNKKTFDLSEAKLDAISAEMFKDCYLIEKIILPESVTSIGDNAFKYCYNLKEIVLPAGLNDANISKTAFSTTYKYNKEGNVVRFLAEHDKPLINGKYIDFVTDEELRSGVIASNQDQYAETYDKLGTLYDVFNQLLLQEGTYKADQLEALKKLYMKESMQKDFLKIMDFTKDLSREELVNLYTISCSQEYIRASKLFDKTNLEELMLPDMMTMFEGVGKSGNFSRIKMPTVTCSQEYFNVFSEYYNEFGGSDMIKNFLEPYLGGSNAKASAEVRQLRTFIDKMTKAIPILMANASYKKGATVQDVNTLLTSLRMPEVKKMKEKVVAIVSNPVKLSEDLFEHYQAYIEQNVSRFMPVKSGDMEIDKTPPPPPAYSSDMKVEENKVYDVVEVPPMFNGNLNLWLSQNIRYPVVAAENGIEGRVIVQFVVSKEGDVSNVTIVRGIDPSLDAEAKRVVRTMPKWIPGYQKGQPVNCKFTLPVLFKLEDMPKQSKKK